jgi:hypothetical protein
MVSSKLVMIGSLCLVGALTSARADNLNTSGTICQAYNAANAMDIDYTVNGVWNRSTAAREIACGVPRSMLSAGSTQAFFIDAYNNAGTCTSCMITLYHFWGAEAASQSVLHCAPASTPQTWTAFVSFPTAAVDDYARVICTLPANKAGTIFGITSIQP